MIHTKNTILALSVLIFSVNSNAQSRADKFNAAKTIDASPGTFTTETKLLPSPGPKNQEKIVIITGVRFSYPLIQKWIDDYNAVNPNVQIIIESRGSSDPAHYDLLIEAYEPDTEAKKERKYLYIARYAVLPVSNSNSTFTRIYEAKGLNQELIQQLFFHDLFADKQKEQNIKVPYTIYTRLQKAGAPITFTKYFGFQQKDIRGKAIAGSDNIS